MAYQDLLVVLLFADGVVFLAVPVLPVLVLVHTRSVPDPAGLRVTRSGALTFLHLTPFFV